MDDERFPKPQVPWFHLLYGSWTGGCFAAPGVAIHPSGDWVAATTICRGEPRCSVPSPTRAGFSCSLSPGHDGPHLSSRDGVIVTSLRRVARVPS